ncbi:type II toxin-antitoxin system HipA family toxin, partial [Tenacibaculum finnmarkense genomovar ulcerans]|nr:type II toxin-antitoxin system HipA family toxin [Tenacibaculum finnmarkense genomovar ulcerans]
MALSEITNCPSTLAKNNNTYSTTALRRVFYGKKVSPILNYDSPSSNQSTDLLFTDNRKRMSISG